MELTADIARELKAEFFKLLLMTRGTPLGEAVRNFYAEFESLPAGASLPPVWKKNGEYYLQQILSHVKETKPRGKPFPAENDISIALIYGAVKEVLAEHDIDIEREIYGP